VATNGHWVANNLLVSLSNPPTRVLSLSGDTANNNPIRNLAFVHNTTTERTNLLYNDIADTSLHRQAYFRNNVLYCYNMVTDHFGHSGSIRGAGRFQQLWATFQVGNESNVIFVGSTGADAAFNISNTGPRVPGKNTSWAQAPTKPNQIAQFVNDTSSNILPTTPSAGGDYHPSPTAFANGRAAQHMLAFDLFGDPRAPGGAVGALETP
jgi:hypothetical protein